MRSCIENMGVELLMPNRLSRETSPYLLQHADNPVDWYPWGEEAFSRARAEDKPILLSVGYSACHWCHVMAHESFENPVTAAVMNDLFVNIKVDREERPDVDTIYMDAVQGMTGSGGWPMTMFLTPDGDPYYGGTYFPPTARHGLPAFAELLHAVADAYHNRPDEVANVAAQTRARLAAGSLLRAPAADADLTSDLLDTAANWLAEDHDARFGGFGGAPKFPQPMVLDFLLRQHVRTGAARPLEIVMFTLRKMAEGGMYDQIGGGFHRYSTDRFWLAPHFEKMLYDNALLVPTYLHAWQLTGNDFPRRITVETLNWVLRDMTDPAGGFYSTLDADSEGVEGNFYVWTPDELNALLGPDDARLVAAYWDVTRAGNFEGKNILHVGEPIEAVAVNAGTTPEVIGAAIARARPILRAARERRVWPGRDEKVLTAWNGLMIRAFAEAAAALNRPDYRAAAERAAAFALTTLRQGDRLLRTYKDGQAKLNGYLEDYASLADGLLALYDATFDIHWLDEARALARTMVAQFWDDGVPYEGAQTAGGFYDTARDHEALIARPRSLTDNAVPAGNSVAVQVLQRFAALDDVSDYDAKATQVLQSLRDGMSRHPLAFGRLLAALDFAVATPREVVLVGAVDTPEMAALFRVLRGAFRPNLVIAHRPAHIDDAALPPLLQGRTLTDSIVTAYVCEAYACQLPVTTPEAFAAQLHDAQPTPGI